uniref:Uncharacterized protein n=1 Tax=Cryptococcus depauperatus TaxID=5208 RepID=D2JWX6_9TREE|nr:hypothetical protein [Cryptococcus depauperatus]
MTVIVDNLPAHFVLAILYTIPQLLPSPNEASLPREESKDDKVLCVNTQLQHREEPVDKAKTPQSAINPSIQPNSDLSAPPLNIQESSPRFQTTAIDIQMEWQACKPSHYQARLNNALASSLPLVTKSWAESQVSVPTVERPDGKSEAKNRGKELGVGIVRSGKQRRRR